MTKHQLLLSMTGLVLLGTGWLLGAGLPSLTNRSEATLVATTAPVLVPAHTKPSDLVAVKMTTVMTTGDLVVSEDGWITSFSQTINGAPESELRFSWIFDTSQHDPYCPASPRVVFVMSLEKVPDVSFAPGYGYFVKKGTKIQILGGFANFSDHDYPSASLTARLTFTPASSGKHLGNAYPLFLNALCDSLFVVPPHKTVVKNLPKPFTVPFAGRIVLLASHAHDFAKEISLTLNGQEIWNTSPLHTPDGKNLGNPEYWTPFNGVALKEGDTLGLKETYVNPTDNPAAAMSSMYIQIVPTSPGDGAVTGMQM
jgi:hypothetical protein